MVGDQGARIFEKEEDKPSNKFRRMVAMVCVFT